MDVTWLKIDDGWINHPKIRAVHRDARSLWLAGAIHAAGQETDGVIAKNMLAIFAAQAEVSPKRASELVAAGLWEDCGDHWEIHDYLAYNASHAELEKGRERHRDRQQKYRESRVTDASRDAVTNTVTDAGSNGSSASGPTRPVIDQDQKTKPRRPQKPTSACDQSARAIVDEWWSWFEAKHGKTPAAGYLATVNTVKALLKSGHDPRAIAKTFEKLGGSRITVGAAERELLHLGSMFPNATDQYARQFNEIVEGIRE